MIHNQGNTFLIRELTTDEHGYTQIWQDIIPISKNYGALFYE
jgi:hypothetical protein